MERCQIFEKTLAMMAGNMKEDTCTLCHMSSLHPPSEAGVGANRDTDPPERAAPRFLHVESIRGWAQTVTLITESRYKVVDSFLCQDRTKD